MKLLLIPHRSSLLWWMHALDLQKQFAHTQHSGEICKFWIISNEITFCRSCCSTLAWMRPANVMVSLLALLLSLNDSLFLLQYLRLDRVLRDVLNVRCILGLTATATVCHPCVYWSSPEGLVHLRPDCNSDSKYAFKVYCLSCCDLMASCALQLLLVYVCQPYVCWIRSDPSDFS